VRAPCPTRARARVLLSRADTADEFAAVELFLLSDNAADLTASRTSTVARAGGETALGESTTGCSACH
jgi:hypothetical protein